MKKTIASVALLLCTALFFNASAQNTQARKNQTRRTVNGVKSGELTRNEARKVRNERRDTKEAVQAAKQDGRVTKAEKKEIVQQKRQASHTIYRTKHNNRKRG